MADENYKYDVFISYRWAWPDRPWVRKRLVPALTRAGLRVWLEISESAPACDLYEETAEAIKSSRKAICVLSPSYVRETEKRARMVAVEFRMLRRLTQTGANSVVPLLLRGKIPSDFTDLVVSNWTNPLNYSREWKRLLTVLQAKDPEAPPPRALELYIQMFLIWTFRISCLVGLVYITILLVSWIPPIPPTPQLVIKTISGQTVMPEMSVAPSGSLAGETNIEVRSESRVFVYIQRKGGGYDELWQCAGTSPVNGKNWLLEYMDFRLPLNAGETKTTIQVLLRGENETCGSLHDSDFSQLTNSAIASSSPLLVTVPRPSISIDDATLNGTQAFAASGTTLNILEDKEDLFICVKVWRDTLEVFSHCFRTSSLDGNWSVTDPAPDAVKSGDRYRVEVGLVPKGLDGPARPDNFTALATKERIVS